MTWVCTHALAKQLWNLHPCKLRHVLAHLGLRSWNKALHRAGPDSRHCARIMQAAMEQRGWKRAFQASILDEPVSVAADPVAPTRVRRTNARILYDALPEDGTTVGQIGLQGLLGWDDRKFASARGQLVTEDMVRIGPGRGGTLARTVDDVASVMAALPTEGSRIGKARLHRELGWGERRFTQAVEEAVASGRVGLGPGRGGSLFMRQAA